MLTYVHTHTSCISSPVLSSYLLRLLDLTRLIDAAELL